MRIAALSSLVLLFGCESGLSRSVAVTLPSVVTSFSAASPGLLVSDLGFRAQPQPFLVLCGQAPKNPVKLSQDLGFGCLSSRDGTTETVRVWVAPLPPGWDADAGCAQGAQERSFYTALSFAPAADAGVDAGLLAADPEAGWAQGTDDGTWRRDLSPCGGVVNFEVTLAVP